MFNTYSHAELLPSASFGAANGRHWQFVELELHHPWLYVELVRNYGDDIVGTMLMVPTVPIFQQMLLELDERSWFTQAHLISPGHMRGGSSWVMEPLVEISLAEDSHCSGLLTPDTFLGENDRHIEVFDEQTTT